MTKKIIVTGASRGIGFELVKKYADNGYETLVISRNAHRLEYLKKIGMDNKILQNVYTSGEEALT